LLPAYFLIAEQLQREPVTTWRQIALPIASVVLIDIHRVIWTLANPDKQALPWFLLISPFLGLMLLWMNFALKRIQEVKTLSLGDMGETAELTQSTGAP
jgi:Na+/melibiose symporter-like transporter